MLMPALSVSVIALVVGLSATVVGGRLLPAILFSAVGAWTGFFVGALVGGLLDVLVQGGTGVLVLGHLAAAMGAVVAVRRLHETRSA